MCKADILRKSQTQDQAHQERKEGGEFFSYFDDFEVKGPC